MFRAQGVSESGFGGFRVSNLDFMAIVGCQIRLSRHIGRFLNSSFGIPKYMTQDQHKLCRLHRDLGAVLGYVLGWWCIFLTAQIAGFYRQLSCMPVPIYLGGKTTRLFNVTREGEGESQRERERESSETAAGNQRAPEGASGRGRARATER